MKNIVVVIFVLVGLVGFSQGDNKTDSKGNKQGEWKKYHKNGMLRYVGSFKNNKPIGEFKYYYDTGNLQTKMMNNDVVSYSISYYKTGEVQATGKYINQKRDSTWVYYDMSGYKKSTEYYIKGLKNRISYTYFQDGKIAEEKEYKNDFEEGMWIQYYDNEKKKMEATYVRGALEGKATYYNSAGKRSISGYYYHDLRNGVWLYFEGNGNDIKKKEEYNKGRRIDKNKEDDFEKEPLKPISEDFLLPENFMSPR